LSRYLDTNTLIGLLTADPLTAQANALLRQSTEAMVISDLAAAEFSGVVGRKVRTGVIARQYAFDVLTALDQLIQRIHRVELEAGDIPRADLFLRRLDLSLQAADAIHIAIAQRLGATLVTFDRRMAQAARTLGVAVAGA
jgi:predicted nucleic acid-binding protein